MVQLQTKISEKSKSSASVVSAKSLNVDFKRALFFEELFTKEFIQTMLCVLHMITCSGG